MREKTVFALFCIYYPLQFWISALYITPMQGSSSNYNMYLCNGAQLSEALEVFFRSEQEDLRRLSSCLSITSFMFTALRLYFNGWLSETPNKLHKLPCSAHMALFGLCFVKTEFKLPLSLPGTASSLMCSLTPFSRGFSRSSAFPTAFLASACEGDVFKLAFTNLPASLLP